MTPSAFERDLAGTGTDDVGSVIWGSALDATEANSTSQLLESVSSGFQILGFDYYSVYEAVVDQQSYVLRSILGKSHEAWQSFYAEHRLYDCDLRVRAARRAHAPFFCSDLLKNPEALEPEERKLFQLAANFGLYESYVLPYRHTDNRSFAAVLIGVGRVLVPSIRVGAQILSTVFVAEALRLEEAFIAASPAPTIKLTSRQLQCLEWCRRGKTSDTIAKITQLSKRTVDEHIATACRHLDASNRVEAVSKALSLGFLPYSQAD